MSIIPTIPEDFVPIETSTPIVCPNAPKCERKRYVDYEKLSNISPLELEDSDEETNGPSTAMIRPKYLRFDESDVKIADRNFIRTLERWYNPSSQPRNYLEWSYIQNIQIAIHQRLHELNMERLM